MALAGTNDCFSLDLSSLTGTKHIAETLECSINCCRNTRHQNSTGLDKVTSEAQRVKELEREVKEMRPGPTRY